MNDKFEQFNRIWKKGKGNKTVQSLMQKVSLRGLPPTEDNCRDFYMGYVRYYKDDLTGQDMHLNPRKNKNQMKALRRNRIAKARRVEKHYRKKK
jgi:hypothetical protein